MPVSLATNRRVIQELRGRPSPLFFPVSITPLNDILSEDDQPTVAQSPHEWQVVRRADTNEVLAVHKNQYKLVSNQELFSQFDDTLAESPIDLTGMLVSDSLSAHGGRCMRMYRFPAYTISIGANDPVELVLKVYNSYDGSSCFRIDLGAYRVVCSNGLVVGQLLNQTRIRHTAGLDIQVVAQTLLQVLPLYTRSTAQWAEWKNTPCPEGVPELVLNSVPGFSDRTKDHIMEHYNTSISRQREALSDFPNSGATLWTLYNALTTWSTHTNIRQTSAHNASCIVAAREEKVRKAIEHPIFRMAA